MNRFDDLDPQDLELLEVARRAARGAADVHRARSPEGREWVEKGRADFVTNVDLEAQEVILATIGEAFPDHRIVAEEEDRAAVTSSGVGPGERPAPSRTTSDTAVRWIVDPLDGTTNWLHGYPEYAASIAAEDADGLRVAVVLNSATGEQFEAVRGAGARRDGRPVRVSSVGDLRMALVGTGFPFKKPGYLDEYLEVFRRLLVEASGIRRGGSAALDLCDLACGRLDAFWELWLMPWDVAAGALILSEAGGHLEALPLPGEEAPTSPGPGPREAASALSGSFASRRGGAYLGSNGALLEAFRAAVRRQEGVRA